MTYDGHLILATTHGQVMALERDFSAIATLELAHAQSENAGGFTSPGYGWIRNGFAIDESSNIYLVSNNHLHKIAWNGSALPGVGSIAGSDLTQKYQGCL